jgi:hypothetical protein
MRGFARIDGSFRNVVCIRLLAKYDGAREYNIFLHFLYRLSYNNEHVAYFSFFLWIVYLIPQNE